MEIIVRASCQPISHVMPVPALRAEVVARHGTTIGSCRAWTVLFSVVLGPTHRVSARWKSIPVRVGQSLSTPMASTRGSRARQSPGVLVNGSSRLTLA